MKTYEKVAMSDGTLKRNTSKQGERLETKVERMMLNGETNDEVAPLIYTEREEGVRPEFDIRTDRFDVAIDATEKIHKSYSARRDERQKAKMKVNKDDSGAEPTQGKTSTTGAK